eukprot:TRINITY_DN15040_c0_g1_i1.p1 TRINITY_DN15040_c0_g1~~TRINITY_DN15040_c0_g1_i1.p1  ORF type:complete len:418 (-),score=99.35 TRINITY_DN15040_c0_g1_i1:75-1328(-)
MLATRAGIVRKAIVQKPKISSHGRRWLMVLGVETSCDDTGVAIVDSDEGILGHQVTGQEQIHARWGGIVPDLARKAHEDNIEPTFQKALSESGKKVEDLDAIAVAIGPGLANSLGVGVRFARELSKKYNLPLVGVNHLEAHALMPRFEDRELEFPYLCLLASGGHTQVILCRNIGDHVVLGGTLDDSIGETFDKVARMINPDKGLGWVVEELALTGNPNVYAMPAIMSQFPKSNLNMSFSGLKSHMSRLTTLIRSESNLGPSDPLPSPIANDVAASFQNALIKHVQKKLQSSLEFTAKEYPQIKSLIVTGGVARNKTLKDLIVNLSSTFNLNPRFPAPSLCTDNGVMIAWTGIEYLKSNAASTYKMLWEPFQVESVNWYPRMPLIDRSGPVPEYTLYGRRPISPTQDFLHDQQANSS